MNAMEMMAKAALEKMMANIPPETIAQVMQIGQTVLSFKAQLDRVEANQVRIMKALNIPLEGEIMELEHARE
jgi:hypothetical protein